MNNPVDKEMSLQLAAIPGLEKPYSPARPWADRRTMPASDIVRLALQAGILLLIALLSIPSYMLISHYVVQQVEVVGESMLPTLHDHSHYLLNRWSLRNQNPRIKDVVVLVDPDDHQLSVKRVVAQAGDSVSFRNGKVYVNGRELQEPYLAPHTHTFTHTSDRGQTIICGKDQYFVLGDNREKSIDSRFFGVVPRENILGLLMIN